MVRFINYLISLIKNDTKNSDISKVLKPDLSSDITYTVKNNQSEIMGEPEGDNYDIDEGFSGQATVIVEKAYFHDSSPRKHGVALRVF